MGRADRDVYLWFVQHRAGWLDPLFLGLSFVGYAWLVWIALALGLSLAARRPSLPVVLATGAVVWSVDIFAAILKEVVDRPRPYRVLPDAHALATAGGDSMPSGHAATSFAGAVFLSALFRRALPGLLLLAVAIAFSRVYIGVHYPGDVLAGAALGAAWALAWLAAFGALGRPFGSSPTRAYSGRAP